MGFSYLQNPFTFPHERESQQNERLLGRVTQVFNSNADRHFPHLGVRFENLVSNEEGHI